MSKLTIPRRTHSARVRGFLLAAQGHKCGICMGPLAMLEAHVDHIIPLVAGGADVESNLQLTHAHCNLRKGRRTAFLTNGQELMPWA